MNDSEPRESAPGVAALDEADFDALIVPVGLELAEHEVYLDLANPGHGPFRALAGQTAGSGNRYLAETSVDPSVWDALVRRDAAAAPDQTLTPDPSTIA